jgi:hypothetical protein
MAVAMVESTRPVTGGVGTHLDSHVGAALDANGLSWVSSRSRLLGLVRVVVELAGRL